MLRIEELARHSGVRIERHDALFLTPNDAARVLGLRVRVAAGRVMFTIGATLVPQAAVERRVFPAVP